MYDERGEYTRVCMTREVEREVSILEVYDERGEYTRSVSRESILMCILVY